MGKYTAAINLHIQANHLRKEAAALEKRAGWAADVGKWLANPQNLGKLVTGGTVGLGLYGLTGLFDPDNKYRWARILAALPAAFWGGTKGYDALRGVFAQRNQPQPQPRPQEEAGDTGGNDNTDYNIPLKPTAPQRKPSAATPKQQGEARPPQSKVSEGSKEPGGRARAAAVAAELAQQDAALKREALAAKKNPLKSIADLRRPAVDAANAELAKQDAELQREALAAKKNPLVAYRGTGDTGGNDTFDYGRVDEPPLIKDPTGQEAIASLTDADIRRLYSNELPNDKVESKTYLEWRDQFPEQDLKIPWRLLTKHQQQVARQTLKQAKQRSLELSKLRQQLSDAKAARNQQRSGVDPLTSGNTITQHAVNNINAFNKNIVDPAADAVVRAGDSWVDLVGKGLDFVKRLPGLGLAKLKQGGRNAKDTLRAGRGLVSDAVAAVRSNLAARSAQSRNRAKFQAADKARRDQRYIADLEARIKALEGK